MSKRFKKNTKIIKLRTEKLLKCTFKKLLTMIICAVLLASNTAFAEQPGYNKQPAAWASEAVDGLRSNGLLYNSQLKEYNKPLTRREFAQLVVKVYHKAKNIPYDSRKYESGPFDDVHDEYVDAAFQLGIVKGVGNNMYAPNSNIERQAICVMLVRLLKTIDSRVTVGDGKDIKFADEGKIASWSKADVAFCYKNEIMNGVAEKTIDPKGNITREQIYTLLYRFCVKYGIVEEAEVDPDYYMLNGFKVPRNTTLEVNSSIMSNVYIVLVGHFDEPDTEQQFADMREILISGGISVELVDKAINGIKEAYKLGMGSYDEATENGRILGLKSTSFSFSISICKK